MVTSIDVSNKDQKLSYDTSELASASEVQVSVTKNGINKYPENGLKIRNGNHSSGTKVFCDKEPKTVVSENLISQPDEKYDDLSSKDSIGRYIIINFLNCEDEDEDDELCGLGSYKPACLRKSANKNMFLFVFSLTSLLQGMYYTYFASILTTIEKLFHIQSKTTGIIMSATEIGQISSALLLTYYGSYGHRPKWISFGIIIFVIACILSSLPHFIYGQDVISIQAQSNGSWQNLTQTDLNLCTQKSKHSIASNSSLWFVGDSKTISDLEENLKREQNHKTYIVLGLLFVSLLMIGTGYTAVQTLGIPYIDDNVAPRESPLYFGMTMGVKILGPVLGFMLGSFCTSIYVYPFDNPGLSSNDHTWIGAWWLGILVIAISLFVVAFPMMSFPRRLKSYNKFSKNGVSCNVNCNRKPISNNESSLKQTITRRKRSQDKPRLREFPKVMHRLLGNKILIWRTASSVLHILPIAGLYTFMPKYLESQFRMTAAKASMIAGLNGMLVMGVGIFISSIFMRKYKPTAKFVAGWIAVSALIYSIGMFVLSFIGCNSISSFNVNSSSSDILNVDGLYQICNQTCICDPSVFFPVCSSRGITYSSLCRAGCSKVSPNWLTEFADADCSCLDEDVTVTKGLCELDCNTLIWYILLFTILVFVHSTSEVGMMMLTLRCVDPEDKSMALGLITFSIGLFGSFIVYLLWNVPCPIIYGALIDSTCQFWENKDGQVGACKMYESHMFRKLFHGITAAVMFLAFLVDIVVWLKASSIVNFSEYENPNDKEAGLPINSEKDEERNEVESAV
ncbi:Solute carrier organic anion transporter family member 1A1 [Nymphon striatum]|nr:Solute carrier organic anion transporter family member 1A1 [Nymphon striatum]